jgi:hypothetical protein
MSGDLDQCKNQACRRTGMLQEDGFWADDGRSAPEYAASTAARS